MNKKRLSLMFVGFVICSVAGTTIEARHRSKSLVELTVDSWGSFGHLCMVVVFAAIVEECNYDVKRIAKMLKAEGATKDDAKYIASCLQVSKMLSDRQIKQIVSKL